MKMPLSDNERPDYCLECIGKMTIQCAWCDGPIYIGSPITLYTPKEGFVIPEHAIRHNENSREKLVGCMRRGCGEMVAMCGYWMPPGEVARVPSPIELCLTTGKAVLVGDTDDYPGSVSLHDLD